MSDFREKIHNARSKLFRRTSNYSTSASATGSVSSPSTSSPSSPRKQVSTNPFSISKPHSPTLSIPVRPLQRETPPSDPTSVGPVASPSSVAAPEPKSAVDRFHSPILTVESPSPDLPHSTSVAKKDAEPHPLSLPPQELNTVATASHSTEKPAQEAPLQASTENPHLINTPPRFDQDHLRPSSPHNYFGRELDSTTSTMSRRKIWIKRAGASPTLVQISNDDLVDDVRDMVLRKYANSLGRNFDAPDVSLRILPRERSQAERILGPEEPIGSILDAYFPGGQSIEEALLIDVPRRRTPQPSPRIMNYNSNYLDDNRPVENGTGYFPLMPATSPHPSQSAASHDSRHSVHQETHPHSISVVETGQLPVLPSPRERRSHHRPKYSRQHTSSPTVIAPSGQVVSSSSSRQQYTRIEPETRRSNHAAPPTSNPALPTPPPQEGTSKAVPTNASTPPLDRINSPRPTKNKKLRKGPTSDLQQQHQDQQQGSDDRKNSHAHPQLPLSLIEATVPPINVLIVEDNPINLRLLEMFTKRLKVRWQTAMNGREAVTKWRVGGFHLVLMDIQLPIMSGLEATKEIRRLERVNGIGVFAKSQAEDVSPSLDSSIDAKAVESAKEDDKLSDEGLFKSPVIIVALTASSLQSDRHEALAAGCNDFLTKPVHFPYLERKVMEWGCMQALIDFDGWRKWKDLAATAEEEKKKEEDLDPELKAKREKKEAKRAALMAKMGQG